VGVDSCEVGPDHRFLGGRCRLRCQEHDRCDRGDRGRGIEIEVVLEFVDDVVSRYAVPEELLGMLQRCRGEVLHRSPAWRPLHDPAKRSGVDAAHVTFGSDDFGPDVTTVAEPWFKVQHETLVADERPMNRTLAPLRRAQWLCSRHTHIEEILFELRVLYGLDSIDAHAAVTAVAFLNERRVEIPAEDMMPAVTS